MHDPREAEELAHEAAELAKGKCPWSGSPLHRNGEGRPGSLSCDVCDCFGYAPREVTGPIYLHVVRWKVVRRTCGLCGRGFPDNTRSTVCFDCFMADFPKLPHIEFPI